MKLGWTKRILPRGLYGRAALILIVPIATLQLVVSLVFLQRHYEGVTQQMTRNLLLEIRHLVAVVDMSPALDEARTSAGVLAGPLELTVEFPGQVPVANRIRFYDLSGRAMVETLTLGLAGATGFDLVTDRRQVILWLETDHGPMRLQFQRGRVSASNPHQLLVLMIFTGLLMTLIAYGFLRNQLRPIRRLAEVASRFGKGETTEFRPRGATEVRQAGQAFMEMRARIERQIEQRTLMLSGVSHDLRTPLTRLQLGLSMLDQTDETAALLRDVGDMQVLLDAFLDFARGEATEDQTLSDPVAIARQAVEDARRSGSQVEFLAVESDVRVTLRPSSIQRALNNLIGNALRYGNRARVSVDVYEKGVRFRVEDDGPGIAPQDRDAALRAFARLEPGRNQNKGTGVGLGLTITADIARGHGGTLRLSESGALGGLQADLVIAR